MCPKTLGSGAVALSVPSGVVERRIYLIRDIKVLLDCDLAELYDVPTGRLNEAVKRNRKRFPKDFMFQLSITEHRRLPSQNAISNEGRGGRRTRPYAFTEQGVAMLSSVLNSERAIAVNIAIMRAFVKLREIAATHRELATKIKQLEKKCSIHDDEISQIFVAIRRLMEPQANRRQIGFQP